MKRSPGGVHSPNSQRTVRCQTVYEARPAPARISEVAPGHYPEWSDAFRMLTVPKSEKGIHKPLLKASFLLGRVRPSQNINMARRQRPVELPMPNDQNLPSLMIGVAGGSASGKTTLARELAVAAGNQGAILELDRFYHCLGDAPNKHLSNFDEPASLDFDLLEDVLEQLRRHGTASVPMYDFATHNRIGYEPLDAAPLIVVEGILVLWHSSIRDLLDVKLYVDAPTATRFERRIQRDLHERGRDSDSVAKQWNETVQPMHEKYVEPSRQHADTIIDGTADLRKIGKELSASWLT